MHVSSTNEPESTDNNVGASIMKETDEGRDSRSDKPEEISTSEETMSIARNEVSTEGVQREKKKKKKRTVKVRRHVQAKADDQKYSSTL